MNLTDDRSSSSSSSSPEDSLPHRQEQEEEDSQQGMPAPPQGFMEVPFNIQSTQGMDPLAASEAEEEEVALERDACKALPCGHAFHDSCIAKWLAQCHV